MPRFLPCPAGWMVLSCTNGGGGRVLGGDNRAKVISIIWMLNLLFL